MQSPEIKIDPHSKDVQSVLAAGGAVLEKIVNVQQ
jgi:soluble P-type ATPase